MISSLRPKNLFSYPLVLTYGSLIMWVALILASVFIPNGIERISVLAAKIEFMVHILIISTLIYILKKDSIEKSVFKGLFWISTWLFLVDLFFYVAVYSSRSYLLDTTIAQFLLYYAPCMIYAGMMILFIIKILLKNVIKLEGFFKILIIAFVLNCIVLGLFINSLRYSVNLFEWKNFAQISLIIIEFILFDFSIIGLIYANNYAICYLLAGNIALVIGDFFLTYSSLFQTIVLFSYGELFWLLGLLMMFLSIVQIIYKKSYSSEDWFYKDNEIRSRLAIWGMGASIIGFLIFLLLTCVFSILNNKVFLSLPLIVMSYSIIAVLSSKIMGRNFNIPFKQLSANIQYLLNHDSVDQISHHFSISEFIFINNVISETFSAIKEKEKNRKSLSDITAQVAHDIRSPLIAIDSLTTKLHSLIPESERLMLRQAYRRIDDIALSLLGRYKGEVKSKAHKKIIIIYLSISEIVAEKRVEHANKNISIEIQIDDSKTYFAVSFGDVIEFKRMISNLINNSINALNSSGHIKLILCSNNGVFIMKIIDNGHGIPKEKLETILLYEKDNVPSVCGLGLPHAFNYLQTLAGSLKIESRVGIGTTIEISIPQVETPEWLCSEIMFKEDCILIIVDDDQSVHDAWSQKIQQVVAIESKLKVNTVHLYSPEECVKWFELNDNSNVVLFADYEYLNSAKNGLELLKSIKRPIVHKKLVTSHYENENIINALDDGIKLLPKQLVVAVKFNILAKNENRVDLVYIDDQDLNLKTWTRLAKIKNIKIATYISTNDFWNEKELFPLSTPIYVDQDFGNGNQSGLEFTKKLYGMGYTNLYLATGYLLENNFEWLKGITSKRAPFV